MPNPFQRYQSGGFEPVQGIAQAGANIGQTIGSGFANFGAGIAKGLMAYNENRAKKDAAMQDAEVLGMQMLQHQDALIQASGIDPYIVQSYLAGDTDDNVKAAIGDNPFLRKAAILQPALEKLQKIPTMGVSAALSTINTAKGSYAMMKQQDELDALITQGRLENIVDELPANVQKEQDNIVTDVPVDPNNPFFKNVNHTRERLKQVYPSRPDLVEKGVQEYINGIEGSIDSSTASPEHKAEFAAALAAYREGLKDTTGELTDYGREDDFVQRTLAESYVSGQKLAKDMEAKASSTKSAATGVGARKVITPEGKELSKLNKQKKDAEDKVKYYDDLLASPEYSQGGSEYENREMHRRHRAEYAKTIAGIDQKIAGTVEPEPEVPLTEEEATAKLLARAAEERKGPSKLEQQLNELGAKILSEATTNFRSRIAKGERVTLLDIGKAITQADMDQNPTRAEYVMPSSGYGYAPRAILPKQYTPARDILNKAAKALGIKGDTPITAEQMLALQKFMKQGVETQTVAAVEAGKRAEGITPEVVANEVQTKAEAITAPAAPVAKSQPYAIGSINLGTDLVDAPLGAVEKEAAAREFYKSKFGSVPLGFSETYRKMFPEATVRTAEIDVNGQKVPVMVDAKGNITQLKMGEAKSPVDIAKEKAVTFNNTEIADGVRLSGIFSGSVDAATTFRKDYARAANVRNAIQELIEINEMGYETLSPTARARAEQLQSEVIAALRTPIIGPGQVAIYEQEILQDIVKKGTGFFTLESSERAALKGLMSRVDRELVNWPKSMGLEVRVSGNKSQTIRDFRLKREAQKRNLGE